MMLMKHNEFEHTLKSQEECDQDLSMLGIKYCHAIIILSSIITKNLHSLHVSTILSASSSSNEYDNDTQHNLLFIVLILMKHVKFSLFALG